jgi:primosomal protein N' (replication factor Y)
MRAPIVGAERTAEELGKAFPQIPVRQVGGGMAPVSVPDSAAIVVATPGAEPEADGGYAGAVLLDTQLLLLRPDLRAAEEALRRWLNVVALVRGGADDGSVIAVGESSAAHAEILGPVDLPAQPAADAALSRLMIRAPRPEGAALATAAKEVVAIRSARKSDSPLRIRVDPITLE